MNTTDTTALQVPPNHLIILFIIMLVTGILGGLVNYFLYDFSEEEKDGNTLFQRGKSLKLKNNAGTNVLVGISASFLVPLFLSTISSDLLSASITNSLQYFVFGGFCLLAAISSKQFIRSLSAKFIKEIQTAQKEMKTAQEKVVSIINKQDKVDAIRLEVKSLEEKVSNEKGQGRKEYIQKEQIYELLEGITEVLDERERTIEFRKIISLLYKSANYELINDVVPDFRDKIIYDEMIWGYVAITNMNFYANNLNPDYKQKALGAIEESLKVIHDYGAPHAYKLYLYLIELSSAKTDAEKQKMINILKGIMGEIDQMNEVTSYEAYNYISLQDELPRWKAYNDLLRTHLPDEVLRMKEKYDSYKSKLAN